MALDRKKLGFYGEKLAVNFLKRHNCKILTTNFRSNKNEIDIIIEEDREIVFIEVKTRSSSFYCLPEFAVNRRKLLGIINCANDWILNNNYHGSWRIDIISIEINQTKNIAKINRFKNISESL